MTDELRNFVHRTTEHLAGRGPNPNAPPPSTEPNFGGGSEGTGDYPGAPGWRPGPNDTYADQAEGDEELAEDADETDDADGAPVWASADDEDANAAAAAVMETLSPEDAVAIEAGDLALWEQRFREQFPDWDDEAEDGDEDDGELVGQSLQPAILLIEALLAEADLVYPDGEAVDTTEFLRWAVAAPPDAWAAWAAEAGWDGPQPSIGDLPRSVVMEIGQQKLTERLEAIELAKSRGEPVPYL